MELEDHPQTAFLARDRRQSPDLSGFPAIRVELNGEFIYHEAFGCDSARCVTLILESELK